MLVREKQGAATGLGQLGNAKREARAIWAVTDHPALVRSLIEGGLSNVSTGKAAVTIPETGLTGTPQAIAARKTVKAMLAAIVVPAAPPVPGVPAEPKAAPAPKKILEKAAGWLLPAAIALGFALLRK